MANLGLDRRHDSAKSEVEPFFIESSGGYLLAQPGQYVPNTLRHDGVPFAIRESPQFWATEEFVCGRKLLKQCRV